VDIYAIAAVGYNMLTARELFEGSNPVEMMSRSITDRPKDIESTPENPISAELIRIIMAGLEKDPLDRPASVADLLAQLEAITDVPPWTQAEAESWWQENQDLILQEPVPSSTTIS
jgi:serine/threonine-protein kinase